MFHGNILTNIFLIACFMGGNVHADLSKKERDDLMEAMSDAAEKCFEKFDISSSEVEEMIKNPNYVYDPSVLYCFFTEVHMMDKGIFNFEKSMDFSKLYVQREDELERLYKIRKECSKVNDAKVGDGEDGYAERAKLLYECLKENDDDMVLVEQQYRKSK